MKKVLVCKREVNPLTSLLSLSVIIKMIPQSSFGCNSEGRSLSKFLNLIPKR